MRFSLFHLPADVPRDGVDAAEAYRRIIAEAVLAEQLGFDTVWLAEHHFSTYGGVVPAIPVLGAAIAARTDRIRIGAAAAILPMRDPVETAESFAMLDVLSGGRLEFGVGRGFLPFEFAARDLSAEDRTVAFREGLAVVLGGWADSPLDFTGERYRFKDVDVQPKPLQRPHPPVWVAASTSQESFELAGAHGYHLLVNPYNRTPSELAAGLAWYRGARERAGFDPATARITANQHLFVAASAEEAEQAPRSALLRYLTSVNRAFTLGNPQGSGRLAQPDYGSMYPEKVLFGTPDAVTRRIEAWAALGITDLCFMTQFGDLDPGLAADSLRLFAAEVIPCFR